MNFIDWFAGIGGFRFGMEKAGHKCVGFCEKDELAVATYTLTHLVTEEEKKTIMGLPFEERWQELIKDKYKHGEWFSNDIRSVHGDEIPKAEIWCFGAPCTDFSICMFGRKGLKGKHSVLVREIFRLVNEVKEEDKPEWLIYENVEGMLSANRGFDFATILTEMGDLGYDAEWQVLNSKDFGTPQNRRRVFVIGHLRKRGSRQILPFQVSDRRPRYVVDDDIHIKIKEATKQGYALAKQGDSINFSFPDSKSRRGRVGHQIANTLDHHLEQYVIEYIGKEKHKNSIEFNVDDAVYYIDIRRFTPTECLMLQGWDFKHAKEVSNIHSISNIYRQVGNSVTVNVVKKIGERLNQ